MNRPVHGGNLAWAARVASCPRSLIVDFSASINPLGPPSKVMAAIVGSMEVLRSYPDPHYWGLRSALGQFHQLSPEWILPGNGSAELLTWASRELAGQCSQTYLLTPAFGDYWRALAANGATIQPCPLRGGINCQNVLPKSGLLLNNPHNPTGKLLRVREIEPYLKQFALVVVDEAFMDFLPPSEEQSLIPLVQDYPHLVILRSLTKFYSLPGLRLGYAIAHPDRLARWQKWRDPWPVNALAAAAGEAAIVDSQFQEQTWNWLPPTRAKLFDGLKSLPGLMPLICYANFILVKTECSASQLQAKLLPLHRILIRDCLSFPELGDRYFRVAVLSGEDNQRLLDALKVILT
ncbi:MAG: threonine-phosphate decarboxylase [Prochloron sp. SP5CPC1]|nr:threonine-phosphate decarboxylase [Candidatus Paraprochloron terpiosi SP5CPC1]